MNVPEMTLRDYFAAQALVGITSKVVNGTMPAGVREMIVKVAYQLADAMLAERE